MKDRDQMTQASLDLPSADAPVLAFRGVSKFYGPTAAVADVSLTVAEGEFLTLVGASGSGKSTMLMMIAGFTEPTSGEIMVRGTSIVGVPPHKRRIGVVFQNYALFPHMTVYENLAFPLRNARWADADLRARVEELLAMVRLEDLSRRMPAELSGGQQQRVAIARALAARPQMLLLDEPLGALDKGLRSHMMLELQHLHSNLGTTMVYVTHDQEEALVMSSRIAVMELGKLVAVGRPMDLYDDPKSVFVASFLGHSNIIDDGGAGVFVVRPERIVIGEVPDGWRTLSGRVREAIFLGDRMRYEVDVGRNQSMIVSLSRHYGARTFERGSAVDLGWHPDDARRLT